MPRSKYIYILRATESREILGGWTVKHELNTWLNSKRLIPAKYAGGPHEVLRIRNGFGKEEVISWEDFRPVKQSKKKLNK